MTRACVFVDGENFRRSIVDLFAGFDRREYLPKAADWGACFDWVVDQAIPGGERLRTYWYVIENVEFHPYGLRRLESRPDTLKRVLSRDDSYAAELAGLGEDALSTRMAGIVSELHDRQARFRSRFDGWIRIQEGIAARHDAIEFRRAGVIRYDLFQQSLGREKAVDVKLATDMIILRGIYDVAVIVTGDQDYVPAVQASKDFGKRVVNVAFRTRDGRLLPGGARRLNQVTDASVELDYVSLETHLGLGAS